METITASSFTSPGYEPANARLNANKCWKPSTQNDPNDYLQIDLGKVRILTGLATQGFPSEYVESYRIQYSIDSVKWNDYVDLSGTTKVLWILFQIIKFVLYKDGRQTQYTSRRTKLFSASS